MNEIKALVHDVFGTVVDWRGAVTADGEALGRKHGISGVDWQEFADQWRGLYAPSMNKVRTGELPWTNLDALHRMALDSLLDKFGIAGKLPEEDKALVFETLRVMLSSTMRGLMLTAVLEGLLLCLGYLITGVPNAMLLGAASGAAGLLPLGGTAFIWIPAVIYLWIGAGWGWAVVMLVWSVIVVGLIDNLLKPLTIGKDTGLPAVALFFGITGGLEVYGLLGLFAGPAVIAVFAALVRVYRRSYSGRPSSPLP